jgi:hypothetical protein
MSHEDRQETMARLQSKYGVTMHGATKTIQGRINKGAAEALQAGVAAGKARGRPYERYEVEGQRFYHGTDPTVAKPLDPEKAFSVDKEVYGRDPGANRGDLQKLGERHGVSFQTATAVRAIGSPRVRLPGERRNAEAVFRHVEAGKRVDITTPQEFRPGEQVEGVALQGNAQKAARLLSEMKADPSKDPLSVQFPSMGRGKNEGQPVRDKTKARMGEIKMGKALSGPKITPYYRSYVDPSGTSDSPMDVHALSQAREEDLPQTAPRNPETGRPELYQIPNPKHDPSQSEMIDNPRHNPANPRSKPQIRNRRYQPPTIQNPAWVPNVQDLGKEKGVHAFMIEAHRRASASSGMVLTEGQTSSWHPQRRFWRGITDPEDRGED